MKVRLILLLMLAMVPMNMFADGSDPMPLCRTKGCGPFKAADVAHTK
jgi:hypothetical protein